MLAYPSTRCLAPWLVGVAILALSIVPATAWAQPPKPADTAAPPPAAASGAPEAAPAAEGAESYDEEPEQVTAQTKKEAKRHYVKGMKLLRDQAWTPALASFLKSRSLFPTRAATNNAAIALHKLERYDEALEMFETLLRDFKMKDKARKKAQTHIAELRTLVGTINIVGAEPGAAIVISSQARGEYPPVEPLHVPAGTHVVRVYKAGFEPFETRVDVAGGDSVRVDAKLTQLTESGRLAIAERSGREVEVLVDNVVVGRTPWEGRVAVGDHMVTLRGEGKLGCQPTAAPVKSEQLTSLSLLAEPLEASLRVDPTPPGASVWINSVNVGRGVWLGRLKTGKHQIEVKAEGFLPDARAVELQKGQREVLAVALERDEEAPMWHKPSKWTVDLGASFVFAPSFGGDVASGCNDDCANPVGLGALALVQGSYELGSGWGFGIEAGYLFAAKEVEGREAELQPHGLAPQTGTLDESFQLHALLAGATVGYHLEGDIPAVFRIGAGVMWGQLRDERSGTFATGVGNSYDTYSLVNFTTATYFYLDPSIRVGVRFAEHWELTGSVQALLLIGIDKPLWDNTTELAASSDGIGTFADEELMGSFVFMIAPGANLRYDF